MNLNISSTLLLSNSITLVLANSRSRQLPSDLSNIKWQHIVFLLSMALTFSFISLQINLAFFPGDFSYYHKFFELCSVRPQECFLVSSFEPIFTVLAIFYSYLLKLNPEQTWYSFSLIFYLNTAIAIYIFMFKSQIKYLLLISSFILISSYYLLNVGTLALRFGVASSIFFLGMAIFSGIEPFPYKRFVISCLFVLSILTHYQIIFFLPVLVFIPKIYSNCLNSDSYINYFPILNRSWYLLPKRVACFSSILGLGLIIIIIMSSTLLTALGKSYYIDGYSINSKGLRPLVEFLIGLFLLIPIVLNTSKYIDPQIIKIRNLTICSLQFLTYSYILNIISFNIFGIDGFSRQMQIAFALCILCLMLFKSKNLLKGGQLLILILYSLSISAYTLLSDPSFQTLNLKPNL